MAHPQPPMPPTAWEISRVLYKLTLDMKKFIDCDDYTKPDSCLQALVGELQAINLYKRLLPTDTLPRTLRTQYPEFLKECGRWISLVSPFKAPPSDVCNCDTTDYITSLAHRYARPVPVPPTQFLEYITNQVLAMYASAMVDISETSPDLPGPPGLYFSSPANRGGGKARIWPKTLGDVLPAGGKLFIDSAGYWIPVLDFPGASLLLRAIGEAARLHNLTEAKTWWFSSVVMAWSEHFVRENGFLSTSPIVTDGRLTKNTTQQSVAVFDFVANNFCVFLKNMMAAESDPCLVAFTGSQSRSLQLLRICQELTRLWLSPHLHDVWVSQFPNAVSVEHQDICLALVLYLSPSPFILPRDPAIESETYRSLALRARKCLARSVHPDDLWTFALATVLDYISDTGCRAVSCPNSTIPTKGMRCAACKTIPYCSRDCQKASWKAHKPECSALQLFGERLDGLHSMYTSDRAAAVNLFKERCAEAGIGEVFTRVFLMIDVAW